MEEESAAMKSTEEDQNKSALPGLEVLTPLNGIIKDSEPEQKEQLPTLTHWPMILSCASVAMFHFPLGTILGFSAILFPQLEASDSEIKMSKQDMSWIAGIYSLMAPVGSVITGYLVDRVGRVNTLKLGALPYTVGWICIATADNIHMILVGRILAGITAAMVSSPAMVYIPEVMVPELRGALLGVAPAVCALGMIVVYAKGAYLYWRTVAWTCSLYCLVPLLLMQFWTSESPPWLVSRNRPKDAVSSLTFLLRNRQNKDGMAEAQIEQSRREQELRSKISDGENSRMALLKGFFQPTGYKPFLLLVMIFIFQQFSGIYVTIFYGVTLFQAVGATIDPYLSTVGIGVVRFVFGIIVTVMMRYFGRRTLYLISGTGMAAFMFLGGYVTKQVNIGAMESSMIPGLCIWIFMSLGVVGFVTLPWTMTAEMFPIQIRGVGQSTIMALAHIFMFLALKIFPFLPSLLGGIAHVLWLFSAVSACAVVFVFFFLPETHNKTLVQIQDYFEHNTVYLLRNRKQQHLRDKKDANDVI